MRAQLLKNKILGLSKKAQSPKILIGYFHQLDLTKYTKLKTRIKKHEGFRNKVYLDQLGHPTIGYGHLVKKSDKIIIKKKYSKKYLTSLFEEDFNKALHNFNYHYPHFKIKKKIQEVLVEMIFQLGIKKTLKFKKFNFYLKNQQTYLAALEMINSLWYLQTPKRVDNLIKILINYKNEKK